MSLDLLAVATAPGQEAVFRASELLARRWNGYLTALCLAQGVEPIVGDPAYASSVWAEAVKQSRVLAQTEFEQIKKRIERMDAPVEIKREEAFLATVEDVVGRHALHADLTIMQSPSGGFADAAFEGALFRSGRPVLLMPEAWNGKTIGERIVVAWKAKREAARAIADAELFLREAAQIVVVTVDAQPDGYGGGPGRDISTRLAHKGLQVELRNVDGMGRSPDAALLNEARALDADLIVMGGYGHARFRELVFGGVTRAISKSCPIPVLLAH